MLLLAFVSAAALRPGLAGGPGDFGLPGANGDGTIDRAGLAGFAAMLGGGGDAGLRLPRGATPARSLDTAPDVVPGVEVGADGAYVDCPCIDHVNDTAWAALVSGHDVDGRALVVGGRVFPRDYGSASCRAWDAGGSSFPGCVRRERSRNCYSAWCYVNRSDCWRSDVSDSLLFEGLHWSHFTCGEAGWLGNGTNISALLPIYAGDLTNKGHATRAVQDAPVTMRSNLRAAVMFAHRVTEIMGLGPGALQYRALSDAALRLHPNAYTACVHDINVGNLDLCLGDWWLTAQRSLMMVEFIPVFVEEMVLMVPRVDRRESLTVWDHLSRTFAPFSLELWGAILGTLAVASVLMAVVEGDGVHCLWGSGGGASCGLAKFSASLYRMALSFVCFSTCLQPQTPAGKVLGLGTAFFLTFVGACFTASTAQFLLVEANSARQFGSLPEFLDAGRRVCYDSPMSPILLQVDARISRLGVPCDTDMRAALESGGCDGAVATASMAWSAWANGEFCGYEFVRGALHSYFVGYYASLRLGTSVRHAVASAMAGGAWQSVSGEVWAISACPSPRAREDFPRRLEFTHMLGNNLIFAASCAAALALHWVGKSVERKKRKQHHSFPQRRAGPPTPPPEQQQEGPPPEGGRDRTRLSSQQRGGPPTPSPEQQQEGPPPGGGRDRARPSSLQWLGLAPEGGPSRL